MKKVNLVLIIASMIFTSCIRLDKQFERKFKNILTKEQIVLILEINSDYDQFVIGKHPDKVENLNVAYSFMTDSISSAGSYFNYFYSIEKLKVVQKKIIDVALFDEDKKKNYLNSLKILSEQDEEIKNIYKGLGGSGYDYLHYSYSNLGFLSHEGNMNSISKILNTYQFVVGQILQESDNGNI